MKPLLPILTFLLFFSGISPSLLPPQEFRFALLIGNADYEGAAYLQNPINDIRRLSPLFKKYGFEVTQIENANLEAMGKVLDDFSRKINTARQKYPKAQITTLFYYAGHGLSYEGENYLIPISTEISTPELLKYRAKSLGEIAASLSSADIRLLFFDACRNELPTRSWWRGLPSINENQGLSSPTINEVAYRSEEVLSGTCIGYATALGKRASDGNKSSSPYAEAFASELTENPSEELSKILTNVAKYVGKSTNYKQEPWQSSTRDVGLFRFDNTIKKVVEEKREKTKVKEEDLIPSYEFLPNGLKLIRVEGGSFMMGCDEKRDGNCRYDEALHSVTLSDFRIGETEVTNAQYAEFLNNYRSDKVKHGEYKGQNMIEEYRWGLKQENYQWKAQEGYENYPVVHVTWYGANEFCKYYGGSLPSEEQWEYAARGGKYSGSYKYAGSNDVNEVAWYKENSYSKKTYQVANKKANELGLYDMGGNVWEWCADLYTNNTYNRVLRGSSWFDDAVFVRIAHRFRAKPTNKVNNFGFRMCKD